MKPVISEFSYGFAVVNELVSWPGRAALTAAPLFPSLRREARLGYDVRLDRPGLLLFLQFKVSHFMLRNNAKEIRDGHFPRGSNLYRMYLTSDKRSPQHNLLIDLEDAGEMVYYVAPAFYSSSELTDYFLAHSVCRNSIFVRPSFDGTQGRFNDSQQHHISYMLQGPWFFYSRPGELRIDVGFKKFGLDIETSLEKVCDIPLAARLDEVFETLIGLLQKTTWRRGSTSREKPLAIIIDRLLKSKHAENKADVVSYISSTFFNCQLVVVQKK